MPSASAKDTAKERKNLLSYHVQKWYSGCRVIRTNARSSSVFLPRLKWYAWNC